MWGVATTVAVVIVVVVATITVGVLHLLLLLLIAQTTVIFSGRQDPSSHGHGNRIVDVVFGKGMMVVTDVCQKVLVAWVVSPACGECCDGGVARV